MRRQWEQHGRVWRKGMWEEKMEKEERREKWSNYVLTLKYIKLKLLCLHFILLLSNASHLLSFYLMAPFLQSLSGFHLWVGNICDCWYLRILACYPSCLCFIWVYSVSYSSLSFLCSSVWLFGYFLERIFNFVLKNSFFAVKNKTQKWWKETVHLPECGDW